MKEKRSKECTFMADDLQSFERRFGQMSLSETDLAQEHAVLNSLAFDCRPVRHDAIAVAHQQTFRWAFGATDEGTSDASEAQCLSLGTWLTHGDGIFWISGKPGSGKSTLMKLLSDEPKTSSMLSQWAHPKKAILASHFFWNAGTEMQKSLLGLMQNLVFEIIRQCPQVVHVACPEYRSYRKGQQSPWTISALNDILQKILFKDCDTKFCFLIDGLDEHEGDHLGLCTVLKDLAKSGNIKLCLSSRPWNVFHEAFGHGIPKLYVHELSKQDIQKYTKCSLEGNPRWSSVCTEGQGRWLVEQITERAWGVFLWASLVTKLLLRGLTNRDRFSDIRRRLDSFPLELEPFFMQILDSIEPFYFSKMATTLLITLAASEPLDFVIYDFHDQEYDDSNYALEMSIDPLSADELSEIRETTVSRIDSRTRGLLEFQPGSNKVTVLHRTVLDFLHSDGMSRYLHDKVDPHFRFHPKFSLLKAHLAYIKTTQDLAMNHKYWGPQIERHGFGTYDDDMTDEYEPAENRSGPATALAISKSAVLYAAELDAKNIPDSEQELTQTLDEMERALARFVLMPLGGPWDPDALLREQLVCAGAFNYLYRKVLHDPGYFGGVGAQLALRLMEPSHRHGVMHGYPVRKGVEILRRAVEAHSINPNQLEWNGETAWSALFRHMALGSRGPLSFLELLEEDIISGLLKQGAEPTASVILDTPRGSGVAWGVYLQFSFDVPPEDRYQRAYTRTLDDFLGPRVDFSNSGEASNERRVIAENFLNPLVSAHGAGDMDASFVAKIASVLLYKTQESACITGDIHAAMKIVLSSRLYDALLKEHLLDRKRKAEEMDADEEGEDGRARRQRLGHVP